jgi:membrane-associated phospholipid phosphatase
METKRTLQTRLVLGALAACAIGLIGQTWDLEISRRAQLFKVPGDLRKAISLTEAFAHASGAIAIFGTLLWIDFGKRPQLWRAAMFVLICGALANAAKIVIPRYRPHSLDQSATAIETSWQTWGMPFTGSWFDENLRSFPSGHSATAVAIAIGLTQVYPRGKWIFAFMAAGACFQRLYSSAHFLSDIMGGVAISMIVALWYWRNAPVPPNLCDLPDSNCPND